MFFSRGVYRGVGGRWGEGQNEKWEEEKGFKYKIPSNEYISLDFFSEFDPRF